MGKYKEDSIQSLEPREFVRLKPGLYAGNTDYSTRLVVELFSNSLDEVNLGHGNVIRVTIGKDCLITVEDEGQGFPINLLKQNGKTVLEAAFSVFNTSAKYDEDGVYEGTSLGSYGIGCKLACFLSKKFNVTSWDDKGRYESVDFIDGVFSKRDVGKDTSRGHSGTVVTFIPDEQFFTHQEPNVNELDKLFNEMACLKPGLEIIFDNNGKRKVYNSPNGIKDLLELKAGDDAISNRFIMNAMQNKNYLTLGLVYTSSSSSTIIPYVNYGLTESGAHIVAVKTNITKCLNSWGKKNGMLKDTETLDGPSLQEGLMVVFNLVCPNVTYDIQVKSHVTSNDFVAFINSSFSKEFNIWLDNHPSDAKAIIEKALIAKRASEAAKKARENVKAKAKKKNNAFKLPTKLVDCWTENRAEAELFICEGLSAATGLVAGRDGKTQAVYGVRGKMLSVLKSTPATILKNQEINNLIQALGLECDTKTAKLKYDRNRLRYGKIIAACDADSDGVSIENLLFNILWYLCPELVTNGHVYSAEPPLFKVTTKSNEYVYLRDQKALEEYKNKNEKNISVISRNKG